jgi:hypothetical protein
MKIRSKTLVALLLSIARCSLAPGQQVHSVRGPLLQIAEFTINTTSGPLWTSGGCIVVEKSGEAYIERRSQLAFETKVDLTIYRGQLTPREFKNLNRILADDSLQHVEREDHAAEMDDAKIPKTSSTVGWITAGIQRSGSVQRINYRFWTEDSQTYKGAEPAYVDFQIHLLKTLLPMMSWFHSLDLSQFKRGAFDESKCVTPAKGAWN